MYDESLQLIQPGQLIADRYRIEERIGHGAMGAVWRALHVQLESPVAIKLLNASISAHPEMLERFLREARSAAAVRSSHVVQIFDYGVDQAMPFIAMELLVGEPLDARLDARGVLSPPELDKIFTEVAWAVGNAHDLGVVHRDIKPANIFIAREGEHEVTKVLDFGIAKLIDRRLEAPVGAGTHTGMILGTPSYMSPEQARGERQVDTRSDLWSLAVLAFECLTGRQPFESSSLGDLLVKLCTAEPLRPSAVAAVPPAFDAWFLRGVNKDPAARFASAAEMANELHALLAAAGLGAESRSPSTTGRRVRTEPSEPAPRQQGHAAGSSSGGQPRTEPSLGPQPLGTSPGAISADVLHAPSHASRRWRGVALAVLLLGTTSTAIALFSKTPTLDAAPALEVAAPEKPAAASHAAAAPIVSPAVAAPAEAARSEARHTQPAPARPSAPGGMAPPLAAQVKRAPNGRVEKHTGKAGATRSEAKEREGKWRAPASDAPRPTAVDPFAERL